MDQQLQDAINRQINNEFVASYHYLAMSVYLDSIHLPGIASWMAMQSDEERAHGQKLLQFLLDRGGNVELQAIAKPPREFGTVREVFEDAMKQEQKTTSDIYEVYGLAHEKNDYATLAHLQWFIDEQVEEEKTVGDILGRLELAGDEKTALLVIDDQLGKRPAEPAAGQ